MQISATLLLFGMASVLSLSFFPGEDCPATPLPATTLDFTSGGSSYGTIEITEINRQNGDCDSNEPCKWTIKAELCCQHPLIDRIEWLSDNYPWPDDHITVERPVGGWVTGSSKTVPEQAGCGDDTTVSMRMIRDVGSSQVTITKEFTLYCEQCSDPPA